MKNSVRYSLLTIVAVLAVVGVAALLFFLGRSESKPTDISAVDTQAASPYGDVKDLPIPFLDKDVNGSSNQQGSLLKIGRRQIGGTWTDVWQVFLTTATGPDSEQAVGVDNIYLVLTPPANILTTPVPLDFAISPLGSTATGSNVNYYGYKYSDSGATLEKANRNAATFALRFPKDFYASLKAWQQDTAGLTAFQQNGVTFKKTGLYNLPVMWTPNSLYVFIFNETAGAKIHPYLSSCGNRLLDATEQCDDGNVANADGCSNTCQTEDGFSCNNTGVNGSVCLANICTDTDGGWTYMQSGIVTLNQPGIGQQTTYNDGCFAKSGTTYSSTPSCTGANCYLQEQACQNASHVAQGQYIQCNCTSGACTAICGNSTLEPGEECDLGTQNGQTGSTCTADCKLSTPIPL